MIFAGGIVAEGGLCCREKEKALAWRENIVKKEKI
jgi:hypothetical protein